MVCGITMTASDLQGKQPWERGKTSLNEKSEIMIEL